MALDHLDKVKVCHARTKSGKPCRAAATEGGLCFFHANPAKASELGRIGGRKNRHLAPIENSDALLVPDTAADVRALVGRVIVEVYSGKLHPRIASGLAPLMNLQLRAIEATDLERRLAKLEKLLVGAADATSELDSGDPLNLVSSRTASNGRQEEHGQSPSREGGDSGQPVKASG